MQRPFAHILLIFIGFTALSWAMFADNPSPDLQATWMAGQVFAAGLTDQVYVGDTAFYTMLPHPEWTARLARVGHEGAAFPFVYPPLWAALSSYVSPHVGFETIKAAAQILNPLLMAGTVWLAVRTARDAPVSPAIMTLVGCVILIASLPGGVALEQNQPQILVGFLIVAAIERARAGAPITAGAALALAAAIKLYPALLIVGWVASGRWRAVAGFAVIGGALAALSLALAGWPLHAAFLAEVDTIRRSIIVTVFTYGIDPILAQLAFAEDMHVITSPGTEMVLRWSVLEKPWAWSLASTAALLGILAAAFRTFRSSDDVLVWPILLTLLTFVSPLAWGYHYLAAMAFLPHLLVRFGMRTGLLALLIAVLPLTLPALQLASRAPVWLNAPILIGAAAMLTHAVLFAVAIRPARAARPRALAPGGGTPITPSV